MTLLDESIHWGSDIRDQPLTVGISHWLCVAGHPADECVCSAVSRSSEWGVVWHVDWELSQHSPESSTHSAHIPQQRWSRPLQTHWL